MFSQEYQQKDLKEKKKTLKGARSFPVRKMRDSVGIRVPQAFQFYSGLPSFVVGSWQVPSLYLLTYLKAAVAPVCSRLAPYQSSTRSQAETP